MKRLTIVAILILILLTSCGGASNNSSTATPETLKINFAQAIPTATASATPVSFTAISVDVSAQAGLVMLDPTVRVLVNASNTAQTNTSIAGGTLSTTGGDVQIPVSEHFGVPCPENESFYQTGNSFGVGHPGIDIACTVRNGDALSKLHPAGLASAFATCVVVAIFQGANEAESNTLWSAGRTIVCAAKTADGQEYRSIYGHLAYPDNDGFGDVKLGQVLAYRQPFAAIGNTAAGGLSTGPHLHYELAKIINGQAYYIDPKTFW